MSPSAESSLDPDTALFLHVRDGERAAFDELMRRYEGRILNVVCRTIGGPAGAEDLAQEVFLKVYRARRRFVPKAKFSTWIYTITVNLCLNHLRSRSSGLHAIPRRSLSDGPGGASLESQVADARSESPADAAGRSEMAERVRAAVDALPDAQRVALVLNRFEGVSYEELGAVLGLTVPAVKSLLFRARENVRKSLAPIVVAARVREEGLA